MLQFVKEIDPRRNPLSSLYFVLILFGIPYNLFNNSGYDGNTVWNIGDWLISYEGGFARRGLRGSIIYTISSRLSTLCPSNTSNMALQLLVLPSTSNFTLETLQQKSQPYTTSFSANSSWANSR